MKGVILFADDHVFHNARTENDLFKKFNAEGEFPILPIDNLSVLEKTVSSVSTYRAIILDWNFKKDSGEEGVKIPDETPYEFLKNNKIFSLVYVYSQADIEKEKKEELEALYPKKIFFETKNVANSLDVEYKKIVDGIKKFETDNQHLITPFLWSQAINNSVQTIFDELENADPNWIKEIYSTAKADGAEPNMEVISVFQNLLNESIIQNSNLTNSLASTAALADIPIKDKEESLAKLYNRIYYTKVPSDAPLTTGDVFKLDENTAAILITPECDVDQKCKLGLDFFIVTKTSFSDYLKKSLSFIVGSSTAPSIKQAEKIEKLFNQEEMKIHVLPSFPFEKDKFKSSALIEFQSCYTILKMEDLKNEAGVLKERNYKLNSPYIHQLRQRYLAYTGRIGVPAIPPSLRSYNLK
jgi:hypothetical protein